MDCTRGSARILVTLLTFKLASRKLMICVRAHVSLVLAMWARVVDAPPPRVCSCARSVLQHAPMLTNSVCVHTPLHLHATMASALSCTTSTFIGAKVAVRTQRRAQKVAK